MVSSKPEVKRLYRSRRNRILAGVCGGIGEYLNVDPTIVRLMWVALTLLWGVGLVFYIIAALIIPEEPAAAGEPQPQAGGLRVLLLVAGFIVLLVGVLGLLSTAFMAIRFTVSHRLVEEPAIELHIPGLIWLNAGMRLIAISAFIVLLIVGAILVVKALRT